MRLKGFKLLTVASGSMEPRLLTGDLVLVAPLAEWPVAGQIVSYNSSINNGEIVTHRVLSVDTKHDYVVTRGDNTDSSDPPIRRQQIIGQVSFKSKKLGAAISFLRRPVGLVAAIYVPALLVIAAELKHLSRMRRISHRYAPR
jgi:signal peptidase